MYFLWLAGDNVEDRLRPARYLALYFGCGLLADGAHIISTMFQDGMMIPTLGASGAISGLLGAYVALFPGRKFAVHIVWTSFARVPAWLYFGFWFAMQFLMAYSGLSGVAFWAHAGGFLAGALLVFVFKDSELVAKHRAMSQTMEHGLVARERW
jgi:membrane associated rhomboid family serine protease